LADTASSAAEVAGGVLATAVAAGATGDAPAKAITARPARRASDDRGMAPL
jgi:hypothetical protein